MPIITFLLLLVPWHATVQSPTAGKSLRDELGCELLQQIVELEAEYDVQIVVDASKFPKQARNSYRIAASQASLADLKHFLPLFIYEWRLMPASLVRATKLKYIVFGTGFKLPSETMRRAAIPDYFQEAMFYDVRHSHIDPAGRLYFRTIVHHEFFHYIDFKDDGLVYEDVEWKKMNPPEFKYGRGGKYMREGNVGLVNSSTPGFITPYATSGVEEDKAEVYRCMMLNLWETELRCEDDPLLARKVARMKELVNAFCPDIDEAYWQRLRVMEQPRLTSPGKEDEWAKAHPMLPSARVVAVCEIVPSCVKRVKFLHLPRVRCRSAAECCWR